MKFFIDTANVEDIKKQNDMGVICAFTTNPSLIAKEGRVFEQVIVDRIDRRRTDQRRSQSDNSRRRRHDQEGREIAKIHPNMVVKIPMTVEGLESL